MTTKTEMLKTTGPIVSLDMPYADARGEIQQLVQAGFESAQLITCAKNSVRANHYHKKDWHYCYMVYGSMRYYTRAVGSDKSPSWVLATAGQVVYTPPMEEHAMEFLEDSASSTSLAGLETRTIMKKTLFVSNSYLRRKGSPLHCKRRSNICPSPLHCIGFGQPAGCVLVTRYRM